MPLQLHLPCKHIINSFKSISLSPFSITSIASVFRLEAYRMASGTTVQQLAPQNATIRHPIQELRYCTASATLYASCAGQLWAIQPASGEVVRRWKVPSVKSVAQHFDARNEKNEGRGAKKSKKNKSKNKSDDKSEDVNAKEDVKDVEIRAEEMKRNGGHGEVELHQLEQEHQKPLPIITPPPPVRDEKVLDENPSSEERPAQRRRLTIENGTTKEEAKSEDVKMEQAPAQEVSPKDVEMKDISPEEAKLPKDEIKKMEEKKPDRHPRVLVNTIGFFIITSDGSYIVCATLEDKTIRVLEAHSFEVINEWTAVKRPCGLDFADQESTVLIADKFGDVYAHALHPARSRNGTPNPTTPDVTSPDGGLSRKLSTTPPPYESRPLLGHVSMLTSLTAITAPPQGDETHAKTFIITADRDEHIRITNYPQSYDIEGYCLGHRSFVSKLHVPNWDKEMLISAGGDDELFVWYWRQGKVTQKLDLRTPLDKFLKEEKDALSPRLATKRKRDEENGKGKPFPIAVNGIWAGPLPRTLIVGVERIPAMFIYKQRGTSIEHEMTLTLRGPIFSCAVDADLGWMWVSVDFAHALLQKFEVIGKDPEDYQIYETTKVDKATQFINSEMTFSGVRVGSIGEEGGHPDDIAKRLYTVETLRKGKEEEIERDRDPK